MEIHQAIELFKRDPLEHPLSWFNRLTKDVLGSPDRVINHPNTNQRPSALIAFKAHDAALPILYGDVVEVGFNSLYTRQMLNADNAGWNIPGFGEFFKEVYHYRLKFKRLLYPENPDYDATLTTIQSMKLWMNIIFGQLEHGDVRHDDLTKASIVIAAREVVEKVYSHKNAFYADTDTVFFHSMTADEVAVWIESNSKFGFTLEEHKQVEVRGRKHILRKP